ncbi:ribosomal protein L24e-domain-containing protein [Camillea tinctor]|nr:ribosomal protein L24e-domain-containing protein [Camillea tinctor]
MGNNFAFVGQNVMYVKPLRFCDKPVPLSLSYLRMDTSSGFAASTPEEYSTLIKLFTNILQKNFKMKRNPRKLKWTKAFRKAAGKEMVVDSTLQFAARRNVPVRYNRELVQKTLKAMERISEIRARRERVFYKRRLAGKRARELALDRKLVASHSHLLPRMRGSEKRRLAQQGLAEDEIQRLEDALPAEKGKVFGREKMRLRHDGGVDVEGEEGGMEVD